MQATGHKALQEMNDGVAAQVHDFTNDMEKKLSPLPSNYAKSFGRVQAILKAYMLPSEPNAVIFTGDGTNENKPLLVDILDDKNNFLHHITSMVFNSFIQNNNHKKKAGLDFIYQDDGLSTIYIDAEGGDLLGSLTIKGQVIPSVTHKMYDLSELASLYNIDLTESVAVVKDKVSAHLDNDNQVTHYELDHNYLECLVERQVAS